MNEKAYKYGVKLERGKCPACDSVSYIHPTHEPSICVGCVARLTKIDERSISRKEILRDMERAGIPVR